MDKATLRKKLITQRKEFNADDVAERSITLVGMLLDKVDLSKTKRLHCFLPISESNEPDMRQLIKHVEKLGVEVFATMPNVPVDTVDSAISDYSLGDNVQFDLIIVPMLAYDPLTKHRLGFGGGFYDRLLSLQPAAHAVGVCFKEFVVDNLPVELTDVALDEIIVT